MLRFRRLAFAGLCLAILAQSAWSADNDKFKGGKLRKRDFSGQVLETYNFEDADLELAVFKQCKLKASTFKDANLTSASFSDADCTSVDFRDANLERTGFQSTNLSKANFEGQDFKGGSFLYCNMRGANLKKTSNYRDVNQADLREADLRGANLRGAQNAASAKFKGAKYDGATQWPDGFDLEKSGAVTAGSDIPAPPGTDSASTKSADAKADNKVEVKNMPAGAPKLEVMKALIQKDQWAPPNQGGVKHIYDYKSFKFADPRKSDYPKKDTVYYPVNIVAEITIQFRDGGSRKEKKDQRFEFFKNEFDDWTYKFIQNN